jgi:hypothetical protein
MFEQSLKGSEPPRGISAPLKALWWAKNGDWDKAHRLVMDEANSDAAWVHAYLHRAEGDLGNAGYWYHRAGKPVAEGALDAEWATILAHLIAGG